MGDSDSAEMFRKASAGILQNLSFGTWIYSREKTSQQSGIEGGEADAINAFTATDWEPFEISPCTVPADFNTCFLSAENGGLNDAARAISPKKEIPAMEPNEQAAGDLARANELALVAARAAAATQERERGVEINALVAQMKKKGHDVPEAFSAKLISDGLSVQDARNRLWDEFVVKPAGLDANGKPFEVHVETAHITRDQRDTLREQMEAGLLLRCDPRGFKDQADKGKDFRTLTLVEMARESLNFAGVRTRGMSPMGLAARALDTRIRKIDEGLPTERFEAQYFDAGGAESTSDFPAILANVLNKTLRQAYQAQPRTFEPFCKQVTAKDFKPVQRTMLHDVAALDAINEAGEFHRAQLSDSKVNYSLATFGDIVALTRRVIVNDDLQAFTRVPAALAVAAAQRESNTVWGIITGLSAAIYPGDTTSTNLFHANHKNLNTGGGSALAIAGLASARTAMRVMTGPNGTKLGLVPRFLLVPAALENTALQLISPMNLAVTAVTQGIPEWVRSLTPIVDQRLDDVSVAYWYLVADPAQIDTIEYCYLEGQQGVYLETRQGFEVDGIETKVRMDFAAAAIEYRGLQKNIGS
jgi:hypothetical protein